MVGTTKRDSWFKPYLDLANEALRPDFFQDSPAGQSGGNAPYPGGGAGVSTVPPSGSVTTTNPITGQPQDYFGPERYGGAPALSGAPATNAPAGSGRFSSDYYKQLGEAEPRARVEMLWNTPEPNQTFAPMVGRAPGTSPAPQGVQFGPPLPPVQGEFVNGGAFPAFSNQTPISPMDAWGRNASDVAGLVGNPNTYTAQGMIPRTVDLWGRGNARNASSLQYMSDALARNIQGGANNVQNTWQYANDTNYSPRNPYYTPRNPLARDAIASMYLANPAANYALLKTMPNTDYKFFSAPRKR